MLAPVELSNHGDRHNMNAASGSFWNRTLTSSSELYPATNVTVQNEMKMKIDRKELPACRCLNPTTDVHHVVIQACQNPRALVTQDI